LRCVARAARNRAGLEPAPRAGGRRLVVHPLSGQPLVAPRGMALHVTVHFTCCLPVTACLLPTVLPTRCCRAPRSPRRGLRACARSARSPSLTPSPNLNPNPNPNANPNPNPNQVAELRAVLTSRPPASQPLYTRLDWWYDSGATLPHPQPYPRPLTSTPNS
jgi:hypothetical protein